VKIAKRKKWESLKVQPLNKPVPASKAYGWTFTSDTSTEEN
jgi:hypothetical protein